MATGGPPPEGGVPLSPKVKVHYGRLYQIHEWMTQEEQTRVRARIHLFHAVNSLRPGYFNHQVELMDDTTTKYLPCRDFQVGTCNQRTTHCFTKTKANGKKSSIQVIHGCDLCYYGRWDLGFHTINQCHLKHLLPKGTGETPWDRRERKKKEERTPALTTKQRKEKKPETVMISSSSSSSSSGTSSESSSEEESQPAKEKPPTPSTSKQWGKRQKPSKATQPKIQKPKKKKKKKKRDKLKEFNHQLQLLAQQVATQNKLIQNSVMATVTNSVSMETVNTGDAQPQGLATDPVMPGAPSLDAMNTSVLNEPLPEDPFGMDQPSNNTEEKSLEQLTLEYQECMESESGQQN